MNNDLEILRVDCILWFHKMLLHSYHTYPKYSENTVSVNSAYQALTAPKYEEQSDQFLYCLPSFL